MRWIPLALVGACVLTASGPASADARRFLIAIGSNVGDPAEPRLHYAVRDAERFTDTLREVGSVRGGDAVVVRDPTAAALSTELFALGARLRRDATSADQLMIYVSSHADEGYLHLNGTHYPIRELMAFVRDAPVGVAFLIVDSCRSGSAVQIKGLRPVSGTTVEVSAPEVTGRVIIGSSGSDEYSQESELLQGSYFTHHFISALRGAGDASGDGRVTLQEAYDYAFARTVESTFATPAGAQHPTFRVDLKGRGDLVLSEPGSGRGRLVFPSRDPGEYLVVSADDGELLGQLVKATGPAVFAVEPGRYRVQLREAGLVREAVVTVPDEGQAVISDDEWVVAASPIGVAKGAGIESRFWLGADALLDGTRSPGGTELGIQTEGRFELGNALEIDAAISAEEASASGSGTKTAPATGVTPTAPPTPGPPSSSQAAVELRGGPGISQRWGFVQAAASAQVGGGTIWLASSGGGRDSLAPLVLAGIVPELRIGVGASWEIDLAGFGGVYKAIASGQSPEALIGARVGASFRL